jgi:hypothetical protein
VDIVSASSVVGDPIIVARMRAPSMGEKIEDNIYVAQSLG